MSYFLNSQQEFVEDMIMYQHIYYGAYNKNINHDL